MDCCNAFLKSSTWYERNAFGPLLGGVGPGEAFPVVNGCARDARPLDASLEVAYDDGPAAQATKKARR